jgi:hypothetical protein
MSAFDAEQRKLAAELDAAEHLPVLTLIGGPTEIPGRRTTTG